jgi:hypothetical protein
MRFSTPLSNIRFIAALLLAFLLASASAQAQQTKLLAGDGMADDRFGSSVALNADGQRAVIAAIFDDVSGRSNQGSAYVFSRNSSGDLVQEAKLVAEDGAADDQMGLDPSAASINEDGTLVLVGAFLDDVSGNADQGSAYVFARDASGNWSQEAKLTAAGSAFFGVSTDLSADGTRAIVGANVSNAAYVFNRDASGNWMLGATLTPSDGASGDPQFGRSVFLSDDGTRAFIGSPTDDISGSANQGSAYVFNRDASGNWSQTVFLTADDGATDDRFGFAVTASGDGERLLAGTPADDIDGNNDQGSTYVFNRDTGGNWNQTTKLSPTAGSINPNFGNAVSLSTDGTRAIIGSYLDDLGNNDDSEGTAYVYNRTATGNWEVANMLAANDAAPLDQFGRSVALSGDAQQGLVGSFLDDVSGSEDQGSAYAIDSSALPVELASFTAQPDDKRKAILTWRTLTETNNRGFEIQQRSAETDDWEKVGFKASEASGGTSTEAVSYRFRTEELAYGRHTFRLVQEDRDGTRTTLGQHTPTVEVTLSERYDLTGLYPNPLRQGQTGTAEVAVRRAQDVTAALYDALGRRVRVLHDDPLNANETKRLRIRAGDLSSGVYFLRVRGENFAASEKVVLVR